MPLRGDTVPRDTSGQEKTSAFHDAPPSSREGGEGDRGQSVWVHQGSVTPDQPDCLLS